MMVRGKSLLFNRFTWLYLLLLFPIIDFTLRQILPLPIISSLWDEALLLLLMVICGWRAFETNRHLPEIRKPLLAFAIMGIAFLVFNMHHFMVNVEGFRAVYQYILAFFVGFYFLHYQKDANTVIRWFVAVAGLVGLYGVFQYIVGIEVPAGWCDASEGSCRRSFSIVQSPNILGSYMILASPIALGLVLATKGKSRLLWFIAALILLAALLFTGSRGAWLAIAGAFALISMFMDRRIFITVIIVSLLTAFFVPQVQSRFSHLFSAEYLQKSSDDGRISRWMNAYDIMRDQPFYGVGLGRYGGAVGDRHFGTTYVDSYYFKTLAETGLLGLGIFLWLMMSLMRGSYRIWKQQRGNPNYYLYGGIFVGLLSVTLHNGVENIFEVPFMNTFFWLLAGIMLSLPYIIQNDKEQKVKSDNVQSDTAPSPSEEGKSHA